MVESSKTKNASFPDKTVMSEVNVKANKMVSAKRTYHKDLAITTFFWKFCFGIRTTHKELIWCTNNPSVHNVLFVSAGVLFNSAFFCEYP